MKFNIDPDITQAETLPSSFYTDESVFEQSRALIFRKSWLFAGEASQVEQVSLKPINLVEGFLQEPMILSRTKEDRINCLSNVCTHRANILVHEPKKANTIVCAYHGRKFNMDGKFEFMPEFDSAVDFPRTCDHLRNFPIANWGGFLFTGVSPSFDFNSFIEPMQKRVGFLPIDQFTFREDLSKNYLVNAHWALYCDNYLEGFHIPFVHKDLNAVLDYSSYESVLFDAGSLQIGYSKGGEEVFDLPKGHIDFGKQVAAYYFWLYPNMMFNFYPWGLSINLVNPLSSNKTKVNFLTYVYDESKLESGAGSLLDKVEREDEFVVEGVHRGMQSSSYSTGRFSPAREKGVHHFHRLLAASFG
jgi:choline monooxygenase